MRRYSSLSSIYVRDRETRQTELASVSGGEPFPGGGFFPFLSAGGRHVAFQVGTPGGTYVHELGAPGTPITAYGTQPSAVAFGNQALYSKTKLRFWFQNTGTITAHLSSVSVVGPNPDMFSANNRCYSVVLAGASCAVYVTFRPTSVGAKSAKLQLIIADGNLQTRVLTATGVRSAFAVSPTSRDFGTVRMNTTTAAKTVSISNTGSSALPISSITLGGWNQYQFAQTHNCPVTLAVGASCTINVVYKPTAIGSKAALVNIAPGGGAAIRSVALAGAARRR